MKFTSNAKKLNTGNVNTTKVATTIGDELLESLKNFAFWEGKTQGEVIEMAIEHYLSDKDIQERPEQVKVKEKQGRPKKKLR